MLSLWFRFLIHSILFLISQTSYRTYKIISSYELARPIMGTICLVKQTIHSLCSPPIVPQQQNNLLGLPLSSMNKQRSLYNLLNVELCSTTAKELAQFTLQLYHYTSTSPHATLHAEIYQPTFKTLSGSSTSANL